MSRNYHNHPVVPSTRDVIPGAAVNIVLKQDQPTGRTVSGVVRDVLTRGDHQRGIKVRLADGRVGRVQSIAAVATAAASEDARGDGGHGGMERVGGLDGAAEAGVRAAWGSDGGRNRGAGPRRGMVRDVRTEPDEAPPAQIGLDAYIKPAKQRKRRGKGTATGEGSGLDNSGGEGAGFGEDGDGGAALLGQKEELVRCPVCHDFEGDEAAVAHHVAGHFD